MLRHVVTNPVGSCHKVRASHHNHYYIINNSGTGVCYDGICRRLPSAGAQGCGGCGDMEKTWGVG